MCSTYHGGNSKSKSKLSFNNCLKLCRILLRDVNGVLTFCVVRCLMKCCRKNTGYDVTSYSLSDTSLRFRHE